jgi:hypothetical protein
VSAYFDVQEGNSIPELLYLVLDPYVPLNVVEKTLLCAIHRLVIQELKAVSEGFVEVTEDLGQTCRGRRGLPRGRHEPRMGSFDDANKVFQVLRKRLDVLAKLIVKSICEPSAHVLTSMTSSGSRLAS